MRHHEVAIVEHRVADQPLQEVAGLLAQLRGLRVELLERLR